VPTPAPTVDSLRGVTSGVFTIALAVAAHGLADGMVPSGGSVALLGVVAAALGAGVARWQRTSQTPVLVGVLAFGQLVGHLALSAGDAMPATRLSAPMLAAHLAAVLVGATLVAAAERLYTALSSAIRRCRPATGVLAVAGAPVSAVRDDPPLQRVRLMAASISHRGPPVGAALTDTSPSPRYRKPIRR
jgi:hypothetical protein